MEIQNDGMNNQNSTLNIYPCDGYCHQNLLNIQLILHFLLHPMQFNYLT